MAKQVINVGTTAGDGSGDPLRDAMIKINANFTELYDGIVVQTIVGENGTTLVDISTNSVNANALTGTVPAGVATWDNLGGKPTSVAGFGIADAYTIAQTDAQIASEIDDLKISLAADGGDLKGSVFADDSTLLVDGVNGTLNSSALTKPIALADDEKITFGDNDDLEIFHNSSNGNTIIQETNNNLVIKGSNLFLQSAGSEYFLRGIANGAVTLYYDNVAKFNTSASGIKIEAGVEEKFATLTGATGTVTHDCDNGHIFYHTGAAADWTANFTNLDLTAEYATTLSIVIAQGATAYIPTAVEIGGVAQTILWQGGSAPSGTADGTDVVAFSILNDGGTYVVMGQLVGFS
jgi:hypothetical protein